SQHQSSHQNATPCLWKLCWRAKFDSAWGIELQFQTLQMPAWQLVFGRVVPATRSALAIFGSSVAMLEWTFKVTAIPRSWAQRRNAPGLGTSEGFHSHPSQLLGAFQSVS